MIPVSATCMGLGTAQRNVSAAIVVTLANFAGTNAVPFVLAASILLPLILLSVAKAMGRRVETAAAARRPRLQ